MGSSEEARLPEESKCEGWSLAWGGMWGAVTDTSPSLHSQWPGHYKWTAGAGESRLWTGSALLMPRPGSLSEISLLSPPRLWACHPCPS